MSRGTPPTGPFVVAIDGPAGSGKSTLAKKVAAAVDGVVIDTGAMYRAVTVALLDQGMDTADPHAAQTIAEGLTLRFEPGTDGQRLIVNGDDWSERIRHPRVSAAVSTVAAHPAVRQRMADLQRVFGEEGRVVMEGRDIGSNVFPDARFKFFLKADDEERAKRRLAEMETAGLPGTFDDVLANLRHRDQLDSSRAAAPLICPPDAVVIDTTSLTIDDVLAKMLSFLFS